MRIMVATDGSDTATRAVEFAARMASGLDSGLKIVTVVGIYDRPPDQLLAYARCEHVTPEIFLSDLSDQTLRLAKQRATQLGVRDVQVEAQRGDAAASIVEIARRDGADTIVLGKRGLGRVAGLLLGSVSQKVVTSAPCAVIVVP